MKQPITIERVERALDKLAEIIVLLGDDGVNVLPLYDRIEKELDALRTVHSKMDLVNERAQVSSKGSG